MDEKKLIKTIFCANEQTETTHVLSASSTGEIVATCSICGRSLKFPAGLSKDQFNDLIAKHKETNAGQVTKASIDATLAGLADEEPTTEVVAEPQA